MARGEYSKWNSYISFNPTGEIKDSVVTVGTSPTKMPEDEIHNRTYMYIHNRSGSTIYIGGENVTTVSGLPLDDGNDIGLAIGNTPLYGVSGGSVSINILEVS